MFFILLMSSDLETQKAIVSFVNISLLETVGMHYNINVHEYHSYNTYTVLISIMSNSLGSTETSVS
jgi:hypothetical protein